MKSGIAGGSGFVVGDDLVSHAVVTDDFDTHGAMAMRLATVIEPIFTGEEMLGHRQGP